MNRFIFLFKIFILLSFSTVAMSQGTLTQLKNSGPRNKYINMVFFSEGYTASELNDFNQDSQNLLNFIFSNPPYSWYQDYFNAFSIAIASNESGSDHPTQNIYRDTYFNSSYGPAGMQRLLTIPYGPTGEGKVMNLLMNHCPQSHIVIVIVNDSEYGGAACGQNGWIATTSLNTYSGEIVLHELGHSFANLTDEYTTPYPGWVPTLYPNSTNVANPSRIHWNTWFLPTTPIPTQPQAAYPNVIGLFEGCQFQSTGWYRPKYDCKMNHLFVPFCEVCTEHIIYAMYFYVWPIESYMPPNLTQTIDASGTITLSVNPMQPTFHNLNVQWSINGNDVPGANNSSFIADASALNAGSNKVKAVVNDTISTVKSTYIKPQLQQSVEWTINVTGTIVNNGQDRLHQFRLYPIYPNPFNSEACITYELPRTSEVTITVFDIRGKYIVELFNGIKNEGAHSYTWNALAYPSGVYYIRMKSEAFIQIRKCVLMK